MMYQVPGTTIEFVPLAGRSIRIASDHAASARHLAHVLAEAGATIASGASDDTEGGDDAVVVDVPVGAPGGALPQWTASDAPLVVLASNATRAALHRDDGVHGTVASKPAKARALVATLADLLPAGDARAEARRAAAH